MTTEFNQKRLLHLLKRHGLSLEDLAVMLSSKRKTPVKVEELSGNKIKISLLKQIDKLFAKGLSYYLDLSDPVETENTSVFFRKEQFQTPLNLGAYQRVNSFEDLAKKVNYFARKASLELDRKLSVYTPLHAPDEVAAELRAQLHPGKQKNKRDFLKSLIARLAELNVLVFEFVEHHSATYKANIDGFFLRPNVIVVKRNQRFMQREIFTLAHELGHYLINVEEVEAVDDARTPQNKYTSAEERWCNRFAFHFLAGEHAAVLNALEPATAKNDYHHDLIEGISKETFLSISALYTHLLWKKKVSQVAYKSILAEIQQSVNQAADDDRKRREAEKASGEQSFARQAKPIVSPYLETALKAAYLNGDVGEAFVAQQLKMDAKQLKAFLE